MKNSLLTAALILVFQVQASTAQMSTVDISESLIFENEHVRFEFEPENMGLSSMKDLKTNHEHINPVNGKHLLWEVAFADGNYIYTITNNYMPCSFARIETLPNGDARATMEWNRLRWWHEDDMVSVTVIVDLPKDKGIGEWRIFVENNNQRWGLWSVLFPIVNGFPESGKYDVARPALARGGELIPACDHRISGRYPGGAWPMQFVSFDNSGNSVYLATMDQEARAKDFIIEPIKGLDSQRYPIIRDGRRHRQFDPEPGERAYIEHYVDDMGVHGSDYPDPYPIAFGIHQGGWTEAARTYRDWALKQRWTQKGPLSGRIDIPESILNMGIWIKDHWVWNDATGKPQQMNKPLLDAAKKLDVPIGLHWYSWHAAPHENLHPHYLPAKAGFKERIDELKQNNIMVMPYINGTSVDMNVTDFHKYEPNAVKDEAGGLQLQNVSDNSGRLLSMCGNQVAWHDVIESLVTDIKNQYDATGIYLDQLSGHHHELCFDKSHLHPLGGGSYWTRGNRELLAKVKNVALRNGGNMVVTSEGASEVYLDLLDANLFWSPPSEREIPLMQMVYSGHSIFFGSMCDYTKSDNYFRYAQGQAFIDGRQNGWMDLGLFKPTYSKKVDYLKQCGKYRLNTLKYLVYGQLLDPLVPSTEIGTFSDDAFESSEHEKRGPVTLPAAEARLWKSEDGTLGIFFANYLDKEIHFPFTVNPADYGLPKGKWTIREVGPDVSENNGEFTITLNRTEVLEPGRIKVLELIPEQ